MKLARSRLPVARGKAPVEFVDNPAPRGAFGGQSTRQFAYNLVSYFPNSAKPRGVRSLSGPAAMLNGYFLLSESASVRHLPVETWAKASGPQSLPSPFFTGRELLEKQAKAEEAA